MKTINYKGNSVKIGIYCIRNIINNKIYIGSTKSSFCSRKTKHINKLKTHTHYNLYLQNSWNKYNEENFRFEILFICEKEDVEKYEGIFIKVYKSNIKEFGYNIASVKYYKFNYKLDEKNNKEKSKRKNIKNITKNGHYSTERGLPKPFKLYDLNGLFIEGFNSAKEYVEINGGSKSHISIVLSKRKLLYNKKIILFSNDCLSKKDIKLITNKVILPKKIYLYDLNKNFIREFNSAKCCAEYIGCKDAEVRMCCINRRNRIKKYITKYNKT